jgi:hypothetical protein
LERLDRGEKSSTLVTTDLLFSKGTELFGNITLLADLIDQLSFWNNVMDMNRASYRLTTMQGKK